MAKIGRNDPCPCGSGKKYKKCCIDKDAARDAAPGGGDFFGPELPPGAPVSRVGAGIPYGGRGGAGAWEWDDGIPDDPAYWPEWDEAYEDEDDDFEPDEADIERARMLRRLDETDVLLARLDWASFDFGVDPYDPVIEDILDLELQGHDEDARAECVEEILDRGLLRHASDEVRARLLDELERRLAARDMAQDEAGRLAAAVLPDPLVQPANIGLVCGLYEAHIDGVVDRRTALDDEEAAAALPNERLLALAERAAEDRDGDGVRELLRRTEALGDGALVCLDAFLSASNFGEAAIPMIERIASFGSPRAAALLASTLGMPEEASVDAALARALDGLEDTVVPLLLYSCRCSFRPAYERLFAYEFLVRRRAWEVLELLVAELCEPPDWEDFIEDDDLGEVAGRIAELGDRRAIGHVLAMYEPGALRDGALDALQEPFTRRGWWEELARGVEALDRGEPILIEGSTSFTDIVRARLAGAGTLRNEASLDFETALAQGEWNHAYHAELDWLRPVDLADTGEEQKRIMALYLPWLERRMAGPASASLDGPASADLARRLRQEWMTTRLPDGRIPLAVIQAERDLDPPNPAYAACYRKELLAGLVQDAAAALENDDRETALRFIDTVLAIDPEHAFATRLRTRLEA